MTEKDKKPEIRFAGHKDSWVQHALGEILVERKILLKISPTTPLLAFAAGQGVINRSERKSNNRDHLTLDQTNKIYLLTEYNDIVYNPSNLKYGAIDRNKYGKGVISPIYVTFTTEEEPTFIELIVKSEKFKLRALQFEEGTVVKRQSVKPENLLSLDVKVSNSKDEQKKIGKFFEHIDNLIALNQAKYEKLLNFKKAMLEKMFPKSDALVPEIRFKGFTEPWSLHSFDNVFDSSIPKNTLSRANLTVNQTEIKNVHYGDILINYGSIVDARKDIITFIKDGKIGDYKNHFLKDGDVIFADAAEDEAVGKAIEVVNIQEQKIVSGLHTIACRPKFKIKPYYLGYYLNSNSYHRQLLPLMQGTKVLSLSKSSLAKTQIKLPNSQDEQTKIGVFFKDFDAQITLNRHQYGKLQNIKKSLLEKMFT